jgi:hypothetical protein
MGFPLEADFDAMDRDFVDAMDSRPVPTCTDCGEQTKDVSARPEWPHARLCDVDYASRLRSTQEAL